MLERASMIFVLHIVCNLYLGSLTVKKVTSGLLAVCMHSLQY